MGSSTNPVVFRDPFSSEQLTVDESTDSPRTRANSHAVAHALYPGSTIFSAPGRALSVPRVERMRAAGKSVAKDAGAAGGYGIEMTALPPSMGTPTKEDMALAKWRKWVVEQPNTPVPLATRNKSITSSFAPPISAPMTRASASGSGKGSGSSSGLGSGSGRSDSLDDAIHYNTDSILALRDVELAIDEGLVKQRDGRGSSRITPRVSRAENPFMLIAERMGSRRVRPIILELIRSLGHYIFAVWVLEQGGEMPWIGDDDPLRPTWKSHTLSAVHAARQTDIIPPPDLYHLTFWRAEVEYGLNDANAAVGVYKRQGWAFTQALRSGKYGAIEDVNVLTGSGAGNIVRMLNDLEEAIWGDGDPRDTDLAYELPADFDMYARYVEPDKTNARVKAVPVKATPVEAGPISDWGLAGVLDTIDIQNQGRRETLEELGKKRHAEWLAKRQQHPASPLAT